MDPAGAFMVMEVTVDLDELTAVLSEEEWERIYCSKKVAYGCGKHGKELLKGLTLYARRPQYPDLSSSMSIRLTDEAIGSIEAKLADEAIVELDGVVSRGMLGTLEAEGYVHIAHQGLLVLSVTFRLRSRISSLGYHLVYDSTDASLYLVPCLPRALVASSTPVPRRSGGGRHPQLVLMAHWRYPQTDDGDGDQQQLCVCTPAGEWSSDTTDPWETKPMRFPQLSSGFLQPQVEFSFKGNVFWADLSRGLAYCNLRTNSSVTHFDFIPLPHGYEILPEDSLPSDSTRIVPPQRNRTISCIDGCIKFVCIDRPRGHPAGNQTVKVWTLDILDRRRKEWKVDKCFLWRDLWKRVDFLVGAELWEVEPQHPTLMPDNTLCLMLADKRPSRVQSRFRVVCICRFDMSMNLLWHGTVLNWLIMCSRVLPGNFFKCYPPPEPRENKLPAHKKRKLQSMLALGH